MSYDYIKRTYGLDFRSGERVTHTVTGKSGEVRRAGTSIPAHYVAVRFDGMKHNSPCHPEELAKDADLPPAPSDIASGEIGS